MANSLTTNPVYIDVAGADVTVASGPAWITQISVTEDNSAAAKVVFIDNDDNVVAVIQVAQNATSYWTPASPFMFANGLIYDDSASSVDNGDQILVYFK